MPMIIMPIMPPAIEAWTICFVTGTNTIISPITPRRSIQGARLKNSHHKKISKPPKNPPINVSAEALGIKEGNYEHDQQLQHCNGDARPQSQRLWLAQLVLLRSQGRGGVQRVGIQLELGV